MALAVIEREAIPEDQIDDHASTSSWQDKAEWLRINGYGLSIDAIGNLGGDDGMDGNRWMAAVEGEGRQYAPTIGEAVEQVYEWATTTDLQHQWQTIIGNKKK